jgi:hypothetical protein
MSLSEKKSILEKIKVLQGKTGLSYQVCKNALDKNELDMDRSILWLRESSIIQFVSKNELIKKCSSSAVGWAKGFLETTLESGELKTYYESGELDIIQSNYFSFYIAGIPGNCPFIMFKEELKYFTDQENDEFNEEVVELYNKMVEQYLPEYIQGDWK